MHEIALDRPKSEIKVLPNVLHKICTYTLYSHEVPICTYTLAIFTCSLSDSQDTDSIRLSGTAGPVITCSLLTPNSAVMSSIVLLLAVAVRANIHLIPRVSLSTCEYKSYSEWILYVILQRHIYNYDTTLTLK